MHSLMQHLQRNKSYVQGYLTMIVIFTLGLLAAVAGAVVIASYLITLALAAAQDVIVSILHAHPAVQVVLILILAYVIKQHFSRIIGWVWKLLH
jgi:uncharacterized membrane protein